MGYIEAREALSSRFNQMVDASLRRLEIGPARIDMALASRYPDGDPTKKVVEVLKQSALEHQGAAAVLTMTQQPEDITDALAKVTAAYEAEKEAA